ncbi:MAG: flagellar hook assembly protein FlgD [Gammaproteobacteria bacterium]|nr:flagellar hook assembly protein FlgD [Gammaproteobacteria bacterium]
MANDIDTSLVGNLGLGQRRQASGDEGRLGQEQFLDLMVTQMRNQDPFKPMESGDFLGQLAQFGTVSGIGDMQKTLGELADAVRGQQTLQAASLVDRDVLVAAREAWLPPSGDLRGRVDVPDGATELSVEIFDLHGRLIGELPVQPPADGTTAEFRWDGALEDGSRAEPGFYELRASGRIDGEAAALDVLVAGRVESVSTKGDRGRFTLTVTGLGVVDLDRVRGIN